MHLLFGYNINWGLNFFSIYVTNKIFKSFFTKRDFIRYYYFHIYIFYQNRVFMLIKFVFFDFSLTKIYNFLSIFIYAFKFYIYIYILIYNFTFALFTLEFEVNLQLQGCSWHLVLINFYVFFFFSQINILY